MSIRSISFDLETVVFQVTTKCPYQCPQCYMERGNQQLSLEYAKDIIDYAYSNGSRAIQITGGEPALYDHLPELVAYAHSKGMYAFLATSGYGATCEFYTKLKKYGLTVLCVSINNIIEADNAKSRQSYWEGISAIRIAVQCGLCCFANVVVSDENADQLVLLGDYLSQMGVQGINLLRPIPSFDGKYVPRISEKTIKAMSAAVKNRPELFFVEQCYGEFWVHERNTAFTCRDIGKTTFFVNADSTLSLCSKTNYIKWNSLAEMESLTDLDSIRCTASVTQQ